MVRPYIEQLSDTKQKIGTDPFGAGFVGSKVVAFDLKLPAQLLLRDSTRSSPDANTASDQRVIAHYWVSIDSSY